MAEKRLITEEDVRGLPAGAEIALSKGDVITPAALDHAFERGIRVRWPGSGASASAASRSAAVAGGALSHTSGVWLQLLAQDGQYVVEVRGGRARVHRLTNGAPYLVASDFAEGVG
jgi:hypothetical protein